VRPGAVDAFAGALAKLPRRQCDNSTAVGSVSGTADLLDQIVLMAVSPGP
jgi:hypothetical protein